MNKDMSKGRDGRRTRIVATVGPATASRAMLRRMMEAGVDVMRLNFSHGSHEFHREAFRRIRALSRETGRNVAVLQDLCGIKIRVGTFPEGGVHLVKGSTVRVRAGDGRGSAEEFFVNFPGFVRKAHPGAGILINDGLVELVVTGKGRGFVTARVREGGIVTDRKGVNLRGVDISSPALTEKDRADLALGLSLGVDYVALSFVRTAKDVAMLRSELDRGGSSAGIIAKIERPEALENIDAILSAADGIMVARGDLGVEVGPEYIPLLQKRLIEAANRQGRLVITATQMLESMTAHATPTRAEVSDVATAVMDGSDAVMLSAETSAGKFPVRSVRMMDRIVRRTEAGISSLPTYISKGTYSEAVAYAAAEAAEAVGARYIVAFTQTGRTAGLLSKYRPTVPILGYTLSPEVLRRMALFWGVIPRLMKPLTSIEGIVGAVDRALLSERLARRGDTVVITASVPVSVERGPGTTNFMKLHRVGTE